MQVKIDIKGHEQVIKALDPKQQRTIIQKVTNELARDARAEVRREIKNIYNLKLSDIEVNVKKATPDNLAAYLLGSAKRLALYKFGAKMTKSGVSVMIKRGARVIVKDAFMAQPKGIDYSKRGQKRKVVSAISFVFKRNDMGSKRPYTTANLKTFSIFKLINSKRMVDHIQSFVSKKTGKLLSDHINLLLFGKRKI